MKVLVVDDDPVCRRLLEATLRKWGSEVITAGDGEEALALAGLHKPKVVIADVVMPKMNGYDLCRRIKADESLKHAPVILLTALSDSRDVLAALQCGADGFITKPYENEFLAEYIGGVLARTAGPQEERSDGKIEMAFGGQKYILEPDARQITQLLLSTYDNAIQKNLELKRANQALIQMDKELREANAALKEKQSNLDRDLEAAAGIQSSLLPRAGSDTRALHVAWKFQPCERIGGDIFNMVRLDERHYAFYILDVSGHGVPSALVTVSVSQMLRPDSGLLVRPSPGGGSSLEIVRPSEVFEQLDREYPIERFDKFFTIAYVVVDTHLGTAWYSSAGHPPPILVRADGSVEKLGEGGPLIGQGDGSQYPDEEKSLRAGDRILLYTDGILEHRSPQGELYGEQRLEGVIGKAAGLSLDAMLDGVMEDVTAFGHQAPEDDMSLLGIEFRGRSNADYRSPNAE